MVSPVDANTTSASLLSLTTATTLFFSATPSISDVRKAEADDPTMVHDVRMSMATASALGLAIGITASVMAKSPAPALLVVGACVGLYITYETILSNNPIEVRRNG